MNYSIYGSIREGLAFLRIRVCHGDPHKIYSWHRFIVLTTFRIVQTIFCYVFRSMYYSIHLQKRFCASKVVIPKNIRQTFTSSSSLYWLVVSGSCSHCQNIVPYIPGFNVALQNYILLQVQNCQLQNHKNYRSYNS